MLSRFKLPTLAAAAALLVNCSAPVMAEEVHVATVGHWEIYADETACMARGGYKNGTHLSFMSRSDGTATVGIENSNWKIPKGSYEVVTQIDRTAPQKVKAIAKDDLLIFDFYWNEPTINLLSYGRTLFVTVGAQSFQYELVRSEAMLKALSACVGQRMATANPFVGASKAPPPGFEPVPYAETPSNPYRRM
jgi:hypothetical protein